ncbi:MAG: maleylpyruvate isomerase N-terminal domain-containing protein, partial [Nocardioidaceae bacterium]
MDLNTLYHRTVESWADRVNAVAADQWDLPTPCARWTVRDLVNHVAGEDRWTVPLMQGQTIAEVGDRLDGDLLGDDPIAAALEAAKEAVSVVAERLPRGDKVHLSYGEEDPAEYVWQLAADHLVHGWD